MGKLFSYKDFFTDEEANLYVYFSFCLVLLFLFFSVDFYYFNKISFWISSLLVLQFYVLSTLKNYLSFILKSYYLPLFFISQLFCLWGQLYENSNWHYSFLAIFPTWAAGYFMHYMGRGNIWEIRKKSLLFILCNSLLFASIYKSSILKIVSTGIDNLLIAEVIFIMLSPFICFDFLLRRKRISGIKKIKNARSQKNPHYKNDLFFHDIINHTHGLCLYLESVKLESKGLANDEIVSLLSEVQIMQTLLQDHFKRQHKNLKHTYKMVTFDFSLKSLHLLINHYFNKLETSIKVDFGPSIAKTDSQKVLLYFPKFYRIMNNLIKNIYEEKSKSLELYFELSQGFLILKISNELSQSMSKSDDLADALSKAILACEGDIKSKHDHLSLGLESIADSLASMGGEFDFKLEDGKWQGVIYFPIEIDESDQSNAA